MLFIQLVERVSAKNEVNRSDCDTSVKFCVQVEQNAAIVLRNRAIADLACGYHGNHFNFLNKQS